MNRTANQIDRYELPKDFYILSEKWDQVHGEWYSTARCIQFNRLRIIFTENVAQIEIDCEGISDIIC